MKPDNLILFILLIFIPTTLLAEKLRQPDINKLQAGDLVFRTSHGFISDFARNFSITDKRFSHVGIFFKSGARMQVIHSIHDDNKNLDGVIIEPLTNFLQAASNWAVYRLPLTLSQKNSLILAARKYATQKIPFDSRFDLSTTHNFYCTELVWHAAKKATSGQDIIKNRTLRAGSQFISIEDLYRNGNARLVESLY